MRGLGRFCRYAAGVIALILWAIVPVRADIVYASNFGNNTVTAYDLAGGALLATVVTGGAEADGFNGVRVLANGAFLVAAQNTDNLLEYSSTGALRGIFDPGNTAGLSSPQDVAVGPDGKVYVVSSANDLILKYDPVTGKSLGTFANLANLGGHIGPVGLAFGSDRNLYVTGFDDDSIVKIDGQTGAILESKTGPPGIGFGPAAFGADGNLYIAALDLSTFAGSVYRYDPVAKSLGLFISPGTGGFGTPGGLAFGPDGNLLLVDLVFDANFSDAGSTILKFNALTGAPMGVLVGPGNGLNIPFFLTTAAPVPEPDTSILCCTAVVLVILLRRRIAASQGSRRTRTSCE